MTNYTKSTNFATKDTLTSGDPLKIVRGTEINTEFDNIATAVNSQSDTASTTFTGTVTIPTASVSSTTDSSSVSTGSIITAGGVGVAKALYVGTTANVAGAVTLQSALSVTGVTTVQAGTAAAPAITTTGDTNTGIFFPAADTIAFTEGGAEAMRIDSSGNVGIGTASPLVKLDVVGSGNYDGVMRVRSTGTNTPSVNLGVDAVASADGYVGTVNNFPFQVRTNDVVRATIDTSGNLLVGGTTQPIGTCRLVVQNSGASSNGAGFFFTSTDDRSNLLVQHAGATGATSRTQIGFFNAAGSNVGTINSTGSATSYGTSSDYRLKENIAPMIGALEKVAQLKPCTYIWKEGGVAAQGFIAHELAEVVPDCVIGEKDAVDAEGNPIYQGIDTSFLVATLTAAIQEQQALITTLTNRITALENK